MEWVRAVEGDIPHTRGIGRGRKEGTEGEERGTVDAENLYTRRHANS